MATVRGHNEGTIYRRVTGQWVAAVSLPNGRRRSRYAKTRAEAKAALDDLLRQRDVGVESRRLTLAAFLAGWLDEVRASRAPATLRQYEMIASVHLVPALGKVPLVSLTPTMVAQYLATKRRSLSAQTVRHHRSTLRRALNVALARGLVTRNAAALAEPPRMARDRRLRALTAEQVRSLLDGTVGLREHALYHVAATTGLRQAEQLALSWDDLELDRGLLHVRATLHRDAGEWVLAETKNEESERIVPLTAETVEVLREHKLRMAGERTPAWTYFGLVFTTTKGQPIHGPNLLPPFYAHLARLGLPRITWHDLRHSAASVLLESGVPIEVVSRFLGHATIRVTMDTYGHLTERVLRGASEGMERALSKPSAARSAARGEGS